MCALWHHRGSARHKAQRPPRPPARPPPPPTQPSTHHTGRRPPTPYELRAFRHHRGPARHRAPDKNVHPDGWRNHTNYNTIQEHRASPTGRGTMPSPTAADPSNPSAPYTRKPAKARAPQATQLHNPKHHPTCPHAAASRQPARRRQHRPNRSAAHNTDDESGRRRAPHTRRPKALPHRRHQRPAPRHRTFPGPQSDREPQSPSSGDTQHIGPGVPSARTGTSRAGVPTAARPTGRAGSTAHRNAI